MHGTAAAGRLGGTARYLCGAKVLYGTAYSVVLQWRYRDDSLGRRKGRSVVEGKEVEPCARTSNQGWVIDC